MVYDTVSGSLSARADNKGRCLDLYSRGIGKKEDKTVNGRQLVDVFTLSMATAVYSPTADARPSVVTGTNDGSCGFSELMSGMKISEITSEEEQV